MLEMEMAKLYYCTQHDKELFLNYDKKERKLVLTANCGRFVLLDFSLKKIAEGHIEITEKNDDLFYKLPYERYD